ncbi:YceI family protein [Chryseobacterium sp. cx-311]|uniref:YceI family protein n=1 Tax=Marnyiella aurantia TaxID=2758037 RepID=UPI001AE82D2E|nr:YceI family protein [Marnyiella aurantia]MBP0613438.1 YceI family protein [Marnyiella aurantia]
MKKLSIFALSAALTLAACKESKTDTAATSAEQTVATAAGDNFTVNTEASTVNWTAYHKGGLNPRFGTTKATGTFTVENGALTAGSLVSDINTLTTDPKAVDPAMSDGKTSADLDAHLKNEDFFDVTKYPSVKFDITKVEDLAAGTESKIAGANKTVSGNLTIKDKTVNVSFPAKVEVTENGLTMVSSFTINRQDWGLTYGTEGDAKDWMISQEVDLELNIVAAK